MSARRTPAMDRRAELAARAKLSASEVIQNDRLRLASLPDPLKYGPCLPLRTKRGLRRSWRGSGHDIDCWFAPLEFHADMFPYGLVEPIRKGSRRNPCLTVFGMSVRRVVMREPAA